MSENYLLLEPGNRRVGFTPGATVSQALSEAGYPQNNPCGGRGKCGKCRVRTAGGSAPTAAERDVLSEEELAAGWRLACVSPACPGMTVRLPEFGEQDLRILTAEDTGGAAEWDGQTAGFKLGCDIGTTTVVIYLLHPENGRILHTVSSLNGQIGFGGDVISRIFAVCDDFGRLEELQAAIAETLNRLLRQLFQETGIAPAQICELRVAGNTTMEHLLLAEDPRGMGKSPFTPSFLDHETVTAEALGLELPAGTPVSLMPNLSAFVGGDITAGIYYTQMADSAGLNLLLDIGTNNE
ncbi:MAG: 2Fe-2S iron-sulfur cluster binding domain-containing protein, partial [Firmicutes bacterium]|nr:2Fe-2S iron-sulfur cluster binding domain-containing protein [Bacillota bacterium]